MLKKMLAGVLLGALVLTLSPAEARRLKRKVVTFSAEPCAAVCPYWVYPDAGPDPTKIDPATADPVDLVFKGIDVLLPPDEAWCGDSPLADYDQITVRAPKNAELLRFEAWPEVDWDIVVCKKTRSGLKYLAHGANEPGNPDAIATDPDFQCAALGVGCYEKVNISVDARKRYVLRAYNWGDPADLRARYTFYS